MRMEERSPGVQADSFFECALHLTKSVTHLVQNEREILLTYDAYRTHMTLRVLEHLNSHGVIVYAVPLHAFGKTQPCDTGLFQTIKQKDDSTISEVGCNAAAPSIDVYNLCAILLNAYKITFTAPNIMSAFLSTELWPLDNTKLLNVSRPRDRDNVKKKFT